MISAVNRSASPSTMEAVAAFLNFSLEPKDFSCQMKNTAARAETRYTRSKNRLKYRKMLLFPGMTFCREENIDRPQETARHMTMADSHGLLRNPSAAMRGLTSTDIVFFMVFSLKQSRFFLLILP